MTSDSYTPEMIAMARKIVAKAQFGPSRWREADVLLSGKLDETVNVQIALAAIAETTERAAKYLESVAVKRSDRMKIDALRNGDHLK